MYYHQHRQENQDNGADGDRTRNLLIANQPLSQLSYGPNSFQSFDTAMMYCGFIS